MTTPWILLSTLLMNDGSRYVITDYTYVRKQYCLMAAKTQWANYWESEYPTKALLSTICTDKSNHYNFVNVVCNSKGVCNV